MRPVLIIVFTEGCDDLPSMVEVDKLVFVEHLAVEAFDEAVLGRFTRRDEAVADLMVMRPALQRQACKLRAVGGEQTGRPAAQLRDVIEGACDSRTGQRVVDLDP